MVKAVSLPQELWLAVFSHISFASDKFGHTGRVYGAVALEDDDDDENNPGVDLEPLCLVCRLFWAVLRPRLWQGVALIDVISQQMADNLCMLLSDSDLLALITGVHISLPDHTSVYSHQEPYKQAIGALTRCSGLQDLKILFTYWLQPVISSLVHLVIATPSRLTEIRWTACCPHPLQQARALERLLAALSVHGRSLRALHVVMLIITRSRVGIESAAVDISSLLHLDQLEELQLDHDDLPIRPIILSPSMPTSPLSRLTLGRIDFTWLHRQLLPHLTSSLTSLTFTSRFANLEEQHATAPMQPLRWSRLEQLSILSLSRARSTSTAIALSLLAAAPIHTLKLTFHIERSPMSTALVPFGIFAAPVDPLSGFGTALQLLEDIFFDRTAPLFFTRCDDNVSPFMPELRELRYAVSMEEQVFTSGEENGGVGQMTTVDHAVTKGSEKDERFTAMMAERGVRVVCVRGRA